MNPILPNGSSNREPATVKVAMWSARHRWPVFAVWFVLTIGLFVGSLAMGGIDTGDAGGDPNDQKLEATEAWEVFDAGGSNDPFEQLYFVVAGGPSAAADSSFQSAVGEFVSQLRGSAVVIDGTSTPTFDQLTNPFEAPPEAGLISADGTTVRFLARVPGDAARTRLLLEPVLPIVDATRAAHPEYTVYAIANTFISDDINRLISEGLDESLKLTIPLTMIILLVAFGAVVASVVPLALAITSIVAALGILGIYSQVVGAVSPYATQLLVLIGLAVAIDYSLFMITRFRVERRRGRSRAGAIEASSSTSGRAVFFSGLAVIVSLASLVTLGINFFTSMAVATVSVVFVSVAGSLTFLPATLSILGDRVNLGRPATWLPRLAAALPLGPISRWGRSAVAWLDRRSESREGAGFWGRLVTGVMARPISLTILSAAVLIGVGSPVLHLKIGVTDITAFPDSIDGVAGVKLLNEKWAGGTQLQLTVIVTNADRPETEAAMERLKTEGLKLDELNEPSDIRPSRDGKVAAVSFTMAGGQNDEANRDVVREVREELNPSVFGGLPDVRTYVTGGAAVSADVTKVYADGTPLIFLFVLGLSFLLMLVAFHSLVIPVKAILLNLLSTAAAYGALVLVFQDGWLAEPLGITPSGVIESWVPIFVFAVLFGLSMDYHLFILTRIKEARDRGADSHGAVATGIAATSGVITSAASIMVVVFAVFVTLKFVFLQQLGLGLAVAVFIDATVIRCVLLPASMTLLGDWNWWMPRFLDWIPRVTIEGEPDEVEVPDLA